MAETTNALRVNVSRANAYLERFCGAALGHFIDGKAVAGHAGRTFDNCTPIDGSVLGRIAAGDAHDVNAAASAAQAAFTSWRKTSGARRREILHRVADLIEARSEQIALVECMDTGQALRFMTKAATRGAENFHYFADRAPSAGDGLSLPDSHHLNYTLRQPLGPIAVITPWNTPFMLSTWKIAPALAAGCTVVHKPAEWSPLSAMMLAEIMNEAGVPPGVVNLVNGIGEEAGRLLTEHAAIRATAFIGESGTGSLIMSQGAATLKRVHLELGGKNPVIVFDDADLDRALDAVVFMIYSLNGERCTSSSRLLVQESIAAEFTARVADRVRKLRVGHPLDPQTEVGPLIHPRHVQKVLAYVEIARQEGARVEVGGARYAEQKDGQYVLPTLLVGARQSMRIAREEIFGPVLTVLTFTDEADAIAVANDTPYGLAAYLWTSDVGRALRVSHELEAGMIWVNSENVRHLATPFGGIKASGIGRDGGDYSFEFYTETKNVALAHGTHAIPRLAP